MTAVVKVHNSIELDDGETLDLKGSNANTTALKLNGAAVDFTSFLTSVPTITAMGSTSGGTKNYNIAVADGSIKFQRGTTAIVTIEDTS